MPLGKSLKRKLIDPICEEFCMESLACHETASPWSYFRAEEPDSSSCHIKKKNSSFSQSTNWNEDNEIVSDPICEEFCMESLACHETTSLWSYFHDEVSDSSNCHIMEKSSKLNRNTNWNVDNEIILGDVGSSSSIFGQVSYQISRRGTIVEYEDSGDDSNTCNHCNASFWAEEALKRNVKN